MNNVQIRTIYAVALFMSLLLTPATSFGQDEPSACVEMGGLAYDNWTKMDSGGTGALPDGAEDSDYIRCKACHGWDHMATDGGYVRRSRNEGRSNAGAGDGDVTSRNISFAVREEGETVTADMIWHQGTGRAYSEGKASWVELDGMHSAHNKAAHSNGYSLGNQHPDFSTGGMTQAQVDCLAEFLNFADADPSVYFSNINTSQNPVLYTIVDTADAAAGKEFYGNNCNGCHGEPAGESPVGHPAGGILAYLAQDGKFSEFSHKARWGIPDESMTRDAMGSPTSADVANMMLWLQEEGGTGFAMTPGMTGTWWNGPERSGEGFPVEVGFQGDGTMVLWVTFFTYNNMGHQTWLTATGTVDGTTTVAVEVFRPVGRMWGDHYDPTDGETTTWGSGTFSFTSCTEGHMSLKPNGQMMGMHGFTDLEYDLIRFDDVVISGLDCPN
jgi:mono/diheme cytochrome c family protein